MNGRMRVVLGLLIVALMGISAPVRGDQSSFGVEWRRPVNNTEDDPELLLQRAEELIERATQAAAAKKRPVPVPVQPVVEDATISVEEEILDVPMEVAADDTTIRLIIKKPGGMPAAVVAEEIVETSPKNSPASPIRPNRQVAVAVAPPAAPVVDATPTASQSIEVERRPSRPAPRREIIVEEVVYEPSDEGVVYAAEEELLPTSPGPFLESGQPILPGGQCEPGCADACCPQPRPLFWVAGVEASFLWPDLNREGGTSFTFEDEGEWYSGFGETSFAEGADSMYLSPRIWLGVQGCAWGANVRYWHLRACEGDFNPATGARDEWGYDEWAWEKTPEVGYFENSCLDAYTIDLEITRRFCLHDCAMQASFGVRHGSIENHESVVGTALGDDARFMGYARSDRYSRGTGIVMGLYGRKPLFPCSCIHWFYNARWSALWGPTGTAAETFAAVTIDGGNAGSVNGAETKVSDTLIIGEIQLGLEWNYALQCLPANAFVRAAVEYQRWDGGKGYSEAGSFATYSDDDDWSATASTFASAAEPQMDLVGITLGTGLTW